MHVGPNSRHEHVDQRKRQEMREMVSGGGGVELRHLQYLHISLALLKCPSLFVCAILPALFGR
jgi:hypothetical protein